MPADIIQDRVEHGESNEMGLGLEHRVFVENESLEVGVSTWKTWENEKCRVEDFGRCFLIESSMASRMAKEEMGSGSSLWRSGHHMVEQAYYHSKKVYFS